VARVLEKGVVVELPREVEGFVPNSQLKRITRGPKHVIVVGDELQLEVIEFDKESKKIILAAQAPVGAEAETEADDETMKLYVVGSDVEAAPAPQVAEPPAETSTPPAEETPSEPPAEPAAE
jgi:small subunit ribosomal protein S1